MKNLKTRIEKLKKSLNLKEEILGVIFVDSNFSEQAKLYRDTVCTAIARAFKTKKVVRLSAKNQLCPGADYFFKFRKVKTGEAVEAYVKKEHVFKDAKACYQFLKKIPKLPAKIMRKNIVISPRLNTKTQVIIFLVNPAQANRILGLLNYDLSEKVDFLPNQPTCISLFAPLENKKPHINFIDYYDRYYQGKIGGKNIWPEEKLVLSLSLDQVQKVLASIEKSPHGNFRAKIKPIKFDSL